MPSFYVTESKTIADFLNAVTEEAAQELWNLATVNGKADLAAYYTRRTESGKEVKLAIRVYLRIESDGHAFVSTDDYRPRKDGKADITSMSGWVCTY